MCHTVLPEKHDDVIYYNASSPDELALANGARHFGMTFVDRDENNNILVRDRFTGDEVGYELLNVLEFTSARKRMSVVVKRPDGVIVCMSKGADSIIIPRLKPG